MKLINGVLQYKSEVDDDPTFELKQKILASPADTIDGEDFLENIVYNVGYYTVFETDETESISARVDEAWAYILTSNLKNSLPEDAEEEVKEAIGEAVENYES